MKKIVILLFLVSSIFAENINIILLDTIDITKFTGSLKGYTKDVDGMVFTGEYKIKYQSKNTTVLDIDWKNATYQTEDISIDLKTVLSTKENIESTATVKAKGDVSKIFNIKKNIYLENISKNTTTLIDELNKKIVYLESKLQKLENTSTFKSTILQKLTKDEAEEK